MMTRTKWYVWNTFKYLYFTTAFILDCIHKFNIKREYIYKYDAWDVKFGISEYLYCTFLNSIRSMLHANII